MVLLQCERNKTLGDVRLQENTQLKGGNWDSAWSWLASLVKSALQSAFFIISKSVPQQNGNINMQSSWRELGRTSTARKPVECVSFITHTLKASWGVHTRLVARSLKEALVDICN